jgi:hypothetical protein
VDNCRRKPLVAQIGRAGDISPIPYWDSLILEYDSPIG